MLELFFSKPEAQKHMEKVLREIGAKTCNYKVLIFRGAGGNGKTVFRLALTKALERLGNIKVVDLLYQQKWPSDASIKKASDTIFVDETNEMKPFHTDDASMSRRVIDFYFDQTFNGDTEDAGNHLQIIDKLATSLTSIMAN